MSERRLLVVTPCRDEAAFAERTLASMAAQTRRPDLWVIVDDGSTDATPEILGRWAQEHAWIRVLRRDDRGRRAVGPGVIEAFYAGYTAVDARAFEYVCKLDLDLDLPPRYFEILIERLEADPRLGTCSGKAWYRDGAGRWHSEGCGDEMSVGMTKLYKRVCFEQIGGFVREVMWDGIDCHRARMLGWTARSWEEPELRFEHLRPMGSSDRGVLRGRMRHGFGQWFMGTDPLFMAASAAYRMTRPPYVLGGLAMMAGYARSAVRGEAQYGDAEFRAFLRRYQRDSLVRGKAAAIRAIEAERAAVFDPARAPAPMPLDGHAAVPA